jgi:hypothetical protein
MAALSPIRLAPPPPSAKTASHRNQMPSSNSLAGGSAYNDRPLVLKGQNVLNSLLPGRAIGGNWPETAFEEVIDINRRGPWTINALTGQVEFST